MKRKRFIALILAIVMTIGMFPVYTSAEEGASAAPTVPGETVPVTTAASETVPATTAAPSVIQETTPVTTTAPATTEPATEPAAVPTIVPEETNAPVDNCPYCEDSTAEDGTVIHGANCNAAYVYDGTADVGRYVQLIPAVAEAGVVVSGDPASDPDGISFFYDEFGADTVMRITEWYWDAGTTGLWYRVELHSGAFPESTADYSWPGTPWILQDYTDTTYEWDAVLEFVTVEEEPEETEPEATTPTETEPDEFVSTQLLKGTEKGNRVGISGMMPAGVSLSVQDVTVNAADYGIADAGSILAALDIRLLAEDGTSWQPYADKQEVEVTIDAAKLGLSDGDVVTLHHNHEGTITKFDPYVVIGGKLTFWTDRFSIYVVSDLRVEDISQEVNEGQTYTMTVGEKRVYWGDFSGWHVVWQVADTTGAISYRVVGKYDAGQEGYATQWAQWIEIEAKDVTPDDDPVKLTFVVNPYGSHTFNVKIIAPNASDTKLYIDDNAAENGCLVPTWTDSGFDASGVQYTWSRSDGLAIRSEALNSDGSVNISIDRGGVTNSRDPLTYTVVATSGDGAELCTASYEVIYGNEILNPSFEKPGIIPNGQSTYYNGYPGLYWKTTAPGEGGNLLRDIEIGIARDSEMDPASFSYQNYVYNPYGIGQAADGKFYAELNAENFGTLYQDMLTTPSAELTWSFSHTKRSGSGRDDTMYVVVAATEYAQSIVNKDNISELLTASKNASQNGTQIPTNQAGYPEGFEFIYNGGTYRIWKSVAKTTAESASDWVKVSGTYKVPQGQYLTRLFFASETDGGDSTLGNMIDGVSAGELMTYRVEYYVAGELKSEYTEHGNVTLYSMQALKNLQSVKGTQYQITGVTVNELDYPGDINNGLYVRDYGGTVDEKDGIVCKVYLDSLSISVTKVIEVEDWTDMSTAQKTALLGDGLTSTFALYDNNGNQVTNGVSSVTILKESAMGKLTALTSFTDLQYGTYTVKETSGEAIDGYTLSTSYSGGTPATDGVKVTLSTSNLFASVVCTNRYERLCGDLRISKFVDKGTNTNAEIDTEKEFSFTVTLTDALPATVPESYAYTIRSYAAGAIPNEQDIMVKSGILPLSAQKTLSFKLKHNQYIVIKDLPVTAYTITEEDYTSENYLAPWYDGGTGQITADKTEVVTCYNSIALSNGDLQITKKVECEDSDANIPKQAFAFTVRLTNAPDSVDGGEYSVDYACDSTKGSLSADKTTYTLTGDTMAYTLPQTVNFEFDLDDYVLTLNLYDGLTVMIRDLPPCGYYVTETDYSAQKFGTTWRGNQTGTLGGQKVNGANPVTELTCINTYNVTTGELQITKNVLKEYGRDVIPGAEFWFSIEPVGSDITLVGPLEVTVGDTTQEVAVQKNTLTVMIPFTEDDLSGLGQNDSRSKTLTVKGLPVGAYAITEADDKNYIQHKIVQQATVGSTPGRVTFANTYRRILGELTISKVLTEGSRSDAQPFLFQITGPNSFSMTVPVEADVPVTIYDLPKGEYTVTELTDWSWRYTLQSQNSQKADLTENASVTLTFTNQYQEDQWLTDTDVEANTFTASSAN